MGGDVAEREAGLPEILGGEFGVEGGGELVGELEFFAVLVFAAEPCERVLGDLDVDIVEGFGGVEGSDDEEGLESGGIAAEEGVEPAAGGGFAVKAAEVGVALVGVVEAVEVTMGEGGEGAEFE